MDTKLYYNEDITVKIGSDNGSVFPTYIKTDNYNLNRMQREDTDSNELLNFYKNYYNFGKKQPLQYRIPQNMKDIYELFEFTENKWVNNQSANYAIYNASAELAGVVSFVNIDWKNNKLTISPILNDMTYNTYSEILEGCIYGAFKKLGVSLVEIISEDNDKKRISHNVDIMDKLGGEYNGTIRGMLRDVNSEHSNAHIWSISRTEFVNPDARYTISNAPDVSL